MSSSSLTRLSQLASSIQESVAQLEILLSQQGLPSPSFSEDAPGQYPRDTVDLRDSIIDCAAEIQDLLQEPIQLLYRQGSFNNYVCLKMIYRFGIAKLVPSGGQTTFQKLAEETSLDEGDVRRALRHAMTMRIFCEPEPGHVAHTRASVALLDPNVNDWVAFGGEEAWPAAQKMVEAMEKWPGSQEPTQTAFVLANGTGESVYEVLEKNPERAGRLGSSMQAYLLMPEYKPSHVIQNYDWESLGSARVVDVGGSSGHISLALAKHFPKLTFTVQDMERMFEKARDSLSDDLRNRIQYMAYDFFTPQTVQADVYFFRWVFHNWSDKYCTLIIKALIPALKAGARIIVNETCMPDPGAIPHWREKYLRTCDLMMGSLFSARERSIEDWKSLFIGIDQRFKFQQVTGSNDSALSIIEFVWADEQ